MSYQPLSDKDLGLEDLHSLHPKVFANLIEQARRANRMRECVMRTNIYRGEKRHIKEYADACRDLFAALVAYDGTGYPPA